MKRVRRNIRDVINLDSLTDIVANSIGVILFILLFAVLSSHSTYFNFYIPSAVNPEEGGAYVPITQETIKSRTNFLCSGKSLIPMDFSAFYQKLSAEIPKVTFDNFPGVVSMLNGRRAETEFLDARIAAALSEEMISGQKTRSYKELKMIISRKQNAPGLTSEQLDLDQNLFYQTLDQLNPDTNWICFYVESDSLEIFRKVRKISWSRGFDVGWEPALMSWPQVIDLKDRTGSSSSWTILPNINQGG